MLDSKGTQKRADTTAGSHRHAAPLVADQAGRLDCKVTLCGEGGVQRGGGEVQYVILRKD